MFSRDLPTFSSFLTRLRSSLAALTGIIGPRAADEWEPLFANDPRFQDENYEVVFATTRSVN